MASSISLATYRISALNANLAYTRDAMDNERRKLYKQVSASTSEDTLDKFDEHIADDAGLPHPPQQRRRAWIFAALVGCIAVSAVVGFVLGNCTASKAPSPPTSTDHSQHTSHGLPSAGKADHATTRILDCGESPARAKAMGCKFDLMLQRWIPAACYDETHSELFLAKYPRKWYYDIDLKQEMDDAIGKQPVLGHAPPPIQGHNC